MRAARERCAPKIQLPPTGFLPWHMAIMGATIKDEVWAMLFYNIPNISSLEPSLSKFSDELEQFVQKAYAMKFILSGGS